MTNTSVPSFKLFLNRVPQSNLRNTVFLPVHQDRKFPDVPCGSIIKFEDGSINPAVKIDVKTCIQRLKQGKNIAIYGMPGGLMFLDLDVKDGKIKASEEFIKSIPKTFTIKTRNGGLQYYYLNHSNAINQDLFTDGVNIGELRVNWQYVVGVGSYVNPDENNANGDGTYRVINDIPLIEMPTEFLNKIKTMISIEKKDSTNLPLRLKKTVMTKEEYMQQLTIKGKLYKRLIK